VLLRHSGIGTRAAYFHAINNAIWCFSFARSLSLPVKPTPVKPGTGVHLGPYRLCVDFCEPVNGSEEIAIHPSTGSPTHQIELEFCTTDDASICAQLLADQFAIVGRDPPSNIRLADDRLSRVHCVLYRCQEHLWVVDLLSSNGTRVNGQRVEASMLQPVDRIKLGNHWLRYRLQGAHAIPERSSPTFTGDAVFEQTIIREQREQIVTRVLRPEFAWQPRDNWRERNQSDSESQSLSASHPCEDRIEAEPLPPVAALPGTAEQKRIEGPTTEPLRIGAMPIGQPSPMPLLADQQCHTIAGKTTAQTAKPGTQTAGDGRNDRPGKSSQRRTNDLLDRLVDLKTRKSSRRTRIAIALALTALLTATLATVVWLFWKP
jgi:hypothetical protein